jgi:hypothetical protein
MKVVFGLKAHSGWAALIALNAPTARWRGVAT